VPSGDHADPPGPDWEGKVRGRRACRITGGVMQIVAATCSEQGTDSAVLFEPIDSGLSAGLLAPPSVVRVVRGTVYIPIVNVGSVEVLLYPRTVLGTFEKVNVVSLPAGIAEVPSTVATVGSHTTLPKVPDQIEGLDLSSLSLSCLLPASEECRHVAASSCCLLLNLLLNHSISFHKSWI